MLRFVGPEMSATRRAGWRWAAVGVAVALLVSVPALAGARPVQDTGASAEQLRDLVRASDQVGWSGYAESRGALALPDVDELGDLGELFGGTTRSRTWWRAPDDWRVDRLDLAGEVDVARAGNVTTTWTSADRRADVLSGLVSLRLPQAVDLLAPVLGRRLAGTPGAEVSRLPARRVAGVDAPGLRVTAADPTATTVEAVDLWVEPDTGLPLRVEVRAGGQTVLTSLLLDLTQETPPAERTRFRAPPDATVVVDEVPDLVAALDRFAPYVLPTALAGSARSDVGLGTGAGVGTYGQGLASFVVTPLPGDVADRLLRALPDDGILRTPLVNAVVGRDGRRTWLLAGTVPVLQLQRGLAVLRVERPIRLE